MKRLRGLGFKSIKHKMLLGFTLVFALVIALGAYNFYTTNIVNNETENIIDQEVPALIANQQIAYTVANRISIVRSFLASGDEVHKQEFAEYTEVANHYLEIIEDVQTNEDQDLSGAEKLHKWEQDIEEKVFALHENRQWAQARSNLNELVDLGEEIMHHYETLALDGEGDIRKSGEEVLANGRMTVLVASGISLLVVIIGIVIALGTARTIANPLREVMERMRAMAEGDLSHKPLETNLQDEIGQLIHATNTMNDNNRELLHHIYQVSEQINGESTTLTTSAKEVRAGSEQVAATMEDLAGGAETQATHASNLSSMMTQFTSRVQEANDNGEQIGQSSKQVLHMTNDGTQLMDQSNEQMEVIDQIVQEAVQKVEGLDAHSKEISELVSVIQDIAEQTNLLALNAAIEAARAGEHGQGFAVVADEVRKLAEEVSHSVTDITGIVNRIQNESSNVSSSLRSGYEEVTEGTSQIRSTRETFQQISSAVEEMVNRIQVVSGNLEQINSSSKEMGSSIEEIAAISEESAAGVEQTSAQSQQASSAMDEVASSSSDLADLAEQLDSLVGRFNL